MRYGFKSEAKREAAQIRKELGLSAFEVLDPWVLAENLGIPVIPLSEAQAWCPDAVSLLTGKEAGAFSGAVMLIGHRKAILINDAHALTRQRSDLSHELAHILLLHEPHALEDGEICKLKFDPEQEEEAAFFSGVLLLTDELCLRAARADRSDHEFAAAVGLSLKMARWRMGTSGARKRVVRERARYGVRG